MHTPDQNCTDPCELCGSTADIAPYPVPPRSTIDPDACVAICKLCRSQIEDAAALNHEHLRCLTQSIWHPKPAVQVLSWRLLKKLRNEVWARDLLQIVDLEDSVLRWAEEEVQPNDDDPESEVRTLDSNGQVLAAGDNVTLIKDLVVKGGGFTAKRGTLVKNIALTANPRHVEGRINGTVIVLVAAFLKKAN